MSEQVMEYEGLVLSRHRELGLIRKRTQSSSGTSGRGSGSGSSVQLFKYLIVIDFESTCWQDAKFRTQEIIEFPAVLLNTLSGEVESEFHYYVQPQEQPTLSAFCTELTGITQNQVDDGIPINLCLRKFGHWLDRLYREKGVVCQGTTTDTHIPVNTTCVTWSDWDLGVCLQYECKRKQLLKPAQLNSWIDLRATYRKFYDRKPNGLNGALQDLGIEFQGREHSGVDDARNTAKLAYRMIRDGCQMKVTKTLKTHERSVSCNPTMQQFVTKATRTTPPRRAKQKITTTDSSVDSKNTTSPSKLPQKSPKSTTSRYKLPQNSPSKIPVRVKTPGKSCTLKKQSETITCSESPSETEFNSCGNDSTKKNVKSLYSQKRKQFTPVKDISKNSTHSPRRKIPRKFSPKKFTSADIYVDLDSSKRTCRSPCKVKESKANNGLSVQDTNVQIDRNTQGQYKPSTCRKDSAIEDAKCFKVPNLLAKPMKQSIFKTPQTSISPKTNTAVCGTKSRSFVTSTPIAGTDYTNGFNQTKFISPLTNQTATLTGSSSFSDCVTPSSSCQSMTGFRTLCQTPSFDSSKHQSGFSINSSNMKVTPPLCKCGRRSKRRMVQSPGQNMGRFFFSCAVRKRVGSKEGCEFFKWETSGMNTQSVTRNNSVISKQFTPVVRGGTQQMSGFTQKRSLGVRSMPSEKMYIR